MVTNLLRSNSDTVQNPGKLSVLDAVIKGNLLLNCNDYRSLREKPITKELAFGRKTFDGPTKDINARLFFHGDKQLKR